MKKTLGALIIAMMVLLLFAACNKQSGTAAASSGGSTATKAKTTVQFWGHVNLAWNASHQKSIDKFNSMQSDIEVVPTFFPYDDFEAKIQTSLATGGAGADLYEIWGGWGLDFVASGVLSEVPADLIADLKSDCYEPVMGAFQGSDGKTYGVPVEFNNEYGGMLVNKPRFAALGISYPTTWDDIISVAKKTTQRNGDIFTVRGLDFTTDDTLTTTFLSMILSQGGQYWVNNKFKLSTPEAEKALQTLVNYVVVDRITNWDSATGAGGIESYAYIGRDEAMMVPRGPWVIASLDEEYGKKYGTDFDYVPFPFFGSVKAFPAETGWSMCVPKSTKVADAAWKYATFFLSKDNLMQHNIDCAQVPARKSVAADPAYLKALPYMAPILDVLQYGKFIGPFNTDVVKADIRNVFVSLCSKDGTYASVKDALAALETQLNTDLKL